MISRIEGCNFKFVTISFDGVSKRTYEAIRRGASYERTLEKILHFRDRMAARGTSFKLNYTVLQSNLDEVPDAVDFWERHGFDNINFIIMVLRKDIPALQQESVATDLDRLAERLFEAARRVIEGNYRIALSTTADVFFKPSALKDKYPQAFQDWVVRSQHPESRYPWNLYKTYQLGKYPGMHVDCTSPFTFARILYNGDLYLCYQFKIGNLYEQTFEEVWTGSQADKVRAGVMRSAKICEGCDFFRFCLNGGRIDFHDDSNSLSAATLAEQKHRYLIPTLVESVRQFNIVGWMGNFYGVPQAMGDFDVRLLELERLPRGIILAPSLEKVRNRILERRQNELSR
jgi:radical SAM protein with 4Fe4S-binding SPASM domain